MLQNNMYFNYSNKVTGLDSLKIIKILEFINQLNLFTVFSPQASE